MELILLRPPRAQNSVGGVHNSWMAYDRREIAAVFAGGALGTLARAGLEELAAPDPGHWPWPTFVANIIGAFLLDRDDPTKVLGRLREPLLSPIDDEREGYVPNVVYSCGSMLHGKELILPFAVSDQASAIATVCLDDLLAALKGNRPPASCQKV